MPERITRNGWSNHRFDALATLITDRVDEPSKAAVDRYVGLEHLDPESLRITRWGAPSDVEATKFLFRSGDIIFGRRRAYQRKLAVADFDGICSAHAMVLRARPEAVLPQFLPLFMQSDVFMARAQQISVGSLSPTINWKTLAEQEFALPPMEEQRRTANVLSSVDALIASLVRTRDRAQTLRLAHLCHFFASKSEQVQRLPDVARILSGNTPSKSTPAFWGGQHPWATAKDLKRRQLTDTEDRLTDAGWREAAVVPVGATLIVVRGMILAHTFPVARCERPMAINQDLRALVATEAIMPDFLLLWTEWMAPHFLSRTGQSTHGTKRLEARVLEAAPIGVPPRSEQVDFITQQAELVEATDSISRRISGAVELKRAIVRGVFTE